MCDAIATFPLTTKSLNSNFNVYLFTFEPFYIQYRIHDVIRNSTVKTDLFFEECISRSRTVSDVIGNSRKIERIVKMIQEQIPPNIVENMKTKPMHLYCNLFPLITGVSLFIIHQLTKLRFIKKKHKIMFHTNTVQFLIPNSVLQSS